MKLHIVELGAKNKSDANRVLAPIPNSQITQRNKMSWYQKRYPGRIACVAVATIGLAFSLAGASVAANAAPGQVLYSAPESLSSTQSDPYLPSRIEAQVESPGAFGAVFSPDGKFMYVADALQGGNTASVFRTSDLAKVASLQRPNGEYVNSVAASPDGKYVYAAGPLGMITRYSTDGWNQVDTPSATVIDVEPDKNHQVTNAALFEIKLSADGKALYATNYLIGNNSLVTIDVSTDQWQESQIRAVAPGWPHLLALSPDGKKAYAAWKGASGVEIFDLEAGSAKEVNSAHEANDFALPAGDMAMSPSGDVFLISKYGLLTRVHNDEKAATVLTKGAAGGQLNRSIALTPDGKYVVTAGGLFVEVYEAQNLSDDSTPVAVYENSTASIGLAMGGEGERVYASDLNGAINVLDLRNIPDSPDTPYQLPVQSIAGDGTTDPSYVRGYPSIDGKSVFFTRNTKGLVTKVSL
ncbi:WD40 repeat domain-containing protein, partial [Leucobacter japonicus]|uniref:WD40 repeat domain-containing protein n=1 Tax=Leucobacter japonicus TaxID=1461259 RepID=UPI00138EE8B5